MNPVSYVFGIAVAVVLLLVVFEMMRRSRLRERHAVWWIVGVVLALVAALFPQTLVWAADLLGIVVPINMVFFVSIGLLFLIGLQHASELTRVEDRVRTLTERLATLDLRVRELEAELRRRDAVAPPGSERAMDQEDADG